MWSITVDDEEVNTAAITDFYEELPDEFLIRQEMPNYIAMEEFKGLMNLFRYGRGEEAFDEFVCEFKEARHAIDRKNPRSKKRLTDPLG